MKMIYITIRLEKIINILVKTTDVLYKDLHTVNPNLFNVYMALSPTPMDSEDFTERDKITYNTAKGGYPLSGIQGEHMYIRVDLNREENEVEAYYYRFLQVLYSAINLEEEGGFNLTINNDVNIIFDSITFDLILKTTSDFYSYDVQCIKTYGIRFGNVNIHYYSQQGQKEHEEGKHYGATLDNLDITVHSNGYKFEFNNVFDEYVIRFDENAYLHITYRSLETGFVFTSWYQLLAGIRLWTTIMSYCI